MIDPTKKITTRPDGSISVETINKEKSMTQQQFAAETDINNIMNKYRTTGELPVLRKAGVYADVSEISDYQTSLNKVLDAQYAFDSLPSDLRTRFGNDPQQMLAFLGDTKNYDEGVKLGLYEPKTEIKSEIKQAQKINDSNDQKMPEQKTDK